MQRVDHREDDAGTQACIQRTLDGEPAAFDPVIERYQRLVWHVISRYLLPSDEADDLLQKSFLEAYRSLDRYDPQRSFANWLCGIARHQCLMAVRSRSIAARCLDAYRQQLEVEPTLPQTESEEVLALRACQERLGGDAAELLRLRYAEGLDFSTIAEAIGRSVGATQRLASRLRDQLRECIERRMETAE